MRRPDEAFPIWGLALLAASATVAVIAVHHGRSADPDAPAAWALAVDVR